MVIANFDAIPPRGQHFHRIKRPIRAVPIKEVGQQHNIAGVG
jgi:hypothetical protein